MAEGFEPYHVPQQSRRDKLRVNNNQLENLHSQAPLYPSFYDTSLISPDLNNLHRQSFNLGANPVKAEGINLMGFMGGLNMITAAASSSSEHRNNSMYADPQLAVQLNPSNIQEIDGGGPYYNNNNNNNNNNYRTVLNDQSFHHGKEAINHPTTTGQSLSLSLSSHHNNSNNLPLELNLQRYDSPGYGNNKVSGLGGGYLVPGNGGGGSSSVELTRSSVPLGPFTGYASVLNRSRFLKPAQQLLEEICEVGRGIYGNDRDSEDSTLLDPPIVEGLCGNHGASDESLSFIDVNEHTTKKSGLLSMLEEVYKRYKMYYQQMRAVVSSFESVAGLSNAAPFANLALKALTKHFKCLKDAITDQLQFATKSHGKMNYERDETLKQRVENSGKGPFGQRSFQNIGFADQPVWRPQRGLPERAVTVLRAWLFEHFLHPYPTDTDKLMLARQTGLSRNQVSNWFINARVRLWKPMVEEIHTLETCQGQTQNPHRDEPPPNPNRPNEHLPANSSFDCENASSSIQRIGEFTLKRNREDLIDNLIGSAGHTNLPYENLTHHPHFTSNAGGNSSVSLTLGLHQNGVGLTESYPMNAARRFGLDSNDDGYDLSGFGGQNRQFRRDIIG